MRSPRSRYYSTGQDDLKIFCHCLRSLGKIGQLVAILLNRFASRAGGVLLPDIISMLIILGCDKCFEKSHIHRPHKWELITSKPGRIIWCSLGLLSLFNIFTSIEFVPIRTIGLFSVAASTLAFCLAFSNEISAESILGKQSSRTVIMQFRQIQLKNRNFIVLCSLGQFVYAVLVGSYFHKTATQNIAFFGMFILMVIALFYWYLEGVALYSKLTRSGLQLISQILIFYKFLSAHSIVWLTERLDFTTFLKLKAFGCIISIFFLMLGFFELTASKYIDQSHPLEKDDEDELQIETNFIKFPDIIRLIRIFITLFGMVWVVFITNFDSGLSNGIFGLNVIFFVGILHYNFTPQGSSLNPDQKISWKSGLQSFLSGQVIFFLRNEAMHGKTLSNENLTTLSVIVDVIGLITTGLLWGNGIVSCYYYMKKKTFSAESANEDDDSQIIFSSYRVNSTLKLGIVTAFSKFLINTGEFCAISSAILLMVVSNLTNSLTVSRHCLLGWICVTSCLVISRMLSNSALSKIRFLTQNLLKGVTSIGLWLIFRLLIQIKTIDRADGLSTFLKIAKCYLATGLTFYMIGGVLMVISHIAKLEATHTVPSTVLERENIFNLYWHAIDSSTSNQMRAHRNPTPRRRASSSVRGRECDSPNQEIKRPVITEEKEELSGPNKDDIAADHFLYFKAFAVLAKDAK